MNSHPIRTSSLVLLPICLMVLLLSITSFFADQLNQHDLHNIVLFDIAITVPIIYLLCIRKTKIPKSTVVSFALVSSLIAVIVMPEQSTQEFRNLASTLIPVFELIVFLLVAWKVRQLSSLNIPNDLDNYDKVKIVLDQLFPRRLAAILAGEFATVYYATLVWRNHPIRKNEYSYHTRSSIPGLVYGLCFITVIETVALHFLVLIFSEIIAWIVTGLSLYALIQLLGIAKGFSRRPVSLTSQGIELRYSLLSTCRIPYTDILSIQLSRGALAEDTIKLSPLGEIEPHNIALRLSSPCSIDGYVGSQKTGTNLVFNLDEPNKFVENVRNYLN